MFAAVRYPSLEVPLTECKPLKAHIGEKHIVLPVEEMRTVEQPSDYSTAMLIACTGLQ